LTDLNPFLRRITADVSAGVRAARALLLGRTPGDGRYAIVLYRTFGAEGRVHVRGRVVKDDALAPASRDHSRWQNFVAMARRIESDPLAYAAVRLSIGSTSVDVTADDDGFFNAGVIIANPERFDDEWIVTRAELPDSAARGQAVSAIGRALVPVRRPEMLIVSDVDDTVLQSNATNLLEAFRTMLLENARTRLPFPGVAAFYRALRRGPGGSATNPIFYVSSSPWNLYDVITEFLDAQGIPAGPVMLRDVDLGLDVLASRHHHVHKREVVRRVLETYPGIPAILVGDSGQQDPEIYRDVVREFQGRIKAVYIRNVTNDAERAGAIRRLADEVLAAGSSLVLADDTMAAARHAAEHGWIAEDALAEISDDKRADEGTSPGKKDAPGARDAGDEHPPTAVVE
jgi:phosphatidate phosphatase APP1